MALNKHSCDSTKLSLILICMGLVTSTKAHWSVDDDGCITPDGGVGSCIPMNKCKSIEDFKQNSAPLSQFAMEKLQGYYCGVLNNSVKVCCPNSPILIERLNIKQPILIEKSTDDDCKTPDEAVGSCIPIKDCKPITDFIQKSLPLSQDTIKTVQEYKCKDIENSIKVCCPNSSILIETVNIKQPILIEQLPDDYCKTPDEAVGSCIPIKDCKPITDFIQKSLPLSQDTIKTVQGYKCKDIENSVKVCCPNSSILIETVNIKQPILIEQSPDDDCKTPDEAVGSCIPIKDCQPITDFIQKSLPLSQDTIKTVQGYKCEDIENSVKVCCPNSSILIETVNIKIRAVIEQPPDVTNHRNLNLLPTDCGLQFSASQIIGGNKTSLFEFPWMALLAYQTGSGIDFKCGGTIINEWYVLTAAHCITNRSSHLKLIGVRLGEYNISSMVDCEKYPFGEEICAPPVQDIAVAETIPHPKYNSTSYTNDIGLIRLISPINTAVENAKPICLPITKALGSYNFTIAPLTVTGWGITETGRRSEDLLKVDVPVTTEENCRTTYKETVAAINHKQICAGGQTNSDSCGGDSGGPLKTSLLYNNDVRYIQFGIVSFGHRHCGQWGFPAVYTRVDYFMDWILENVKP